MSVKSPWVAFLGLLFGTFTVIEAMAFQIPALPTLTQQFGIPVAISGLISLFYYLGHTVFAPVFGNIADQIGRKKIILAGLVVFTISEFVAAMSVNFTMFLIARVFQGIGAACVVPAGIAYATYLFPDQKRGMALGVLSAIGTLGAAAGGIIGGMLISKLGWQAIYVVSGTLSLVGIVLVKLTVPETPRNERKPFDYPGSIFLLLTVGTLLSVTTLIANLGISSPYTISTLLAGLIFAFIFWNVERKSKFPFIDLSLLKKRTFILPLLLTFFLGICYQGVLYTNAFFVSTKPGGGPELAGMLTMYVYLTGALFGLIGGKMVDKFPMKKVILSSSALFVIGAIIYSTYSASTPFWYVAMTVIIMVAAFLTMSPACIKMALAEVSPDKLSTGSGTYTMIRDLGNPTGQTTFLALFGTISVSSLGAALVGQAKQAGVSESMLPAVEEAGKAAGQSIDAGLVSHLESLGIQFQDLYHAAKIDGMIISLNGTSYIVIAISILVLLAAFFLPGTHRPRETSIKGVVQDQSVHEA